MSQVAAADALLRRDVRAGGGRRHLAPPSARQAGRPGRDHGGVPLGRARPAADRHPGGRSAAPLSVAGRHRQRVQPAGQHRRPVGRRRGHRGALLHRHPDGRRPDRAGARPGGVRRRRVRVPLLQLPARVDLHGRRRQLLPRLVPRGGQRAGGARTALAAGVGGGGAAPDPAHPDLRHDVRDGDARPGRAQRAGRRPRSHVAPAGGARHQRAARGARALRPRRGRAGSSPSRCSRRG